jgi:hypothetical protein
MRNRRLLIIVAVLMGITALTAGLTAPPSRRGEPVLTTPPTTRATTDAALVQRTIDADATRPPTVAVEQGDALHLTVRADALDSVELEGLGLVQALAPDSPALFDVLADEAGTYPVVLTGSGRRVGAVRVNPAQE